MKRLAVFLAIFLAFLFEIGFGIAAISCSNSDQVLFSLSRERNAHAASDDRFDFDLCFDDYFSDEFSGGNAGDATVVWLSADTNAHGSGPDANPHYPIEILYGDLNCMLRTDLCEGFSEGERRSSFIASLSGEHNAHFALGGVAPNSLCCISTSQDAICDYNGACEGSESSLNCPFDCGASPCGNGIDEVFLGEECDDGDNENGNDCTNFCKLAVCGDGIVWNEGSGIEECDDGNTVSGDGCSATCRNENSGVQCPGLENYVYRDGSASLVQITECSHVNSYDGPSVGGVSNDELYLCETCSGLYGVPESLGSACTYDAGTCSAVSSGNLFDACVFDIVDEYSCAEGELNAQATVRKTGAGCNCPNGLDQCETIESVPCPRVVTLPFFGFFGFVFSFILIGLIYYVLERKP